MKPNPEWKDAPYECSVAEFAGWRKGEPVFRQAVITKQPPSRPFEYLIDAEGRARKISKKLREQMKRKL